MVSEATDRLLGADTDLERDRKILRTVEKEDRGAFAVLPMLSVLLGALDGAQGEINWLMTDVYLPLYSLRIYLRRLASQACTCL